jgi:nucleoid-associated protein YgaU/DNA-binding SARP family transcriptional activator
MNQLARLARGVGALATLLVLLGGVPAFLALAVGWPLPRSIPAWNDVTATFAGDLPLDATTVWKVLACVVWMGWVQVAAATIVEASALARGGVALPIRGLAHMQGLTGPLLGAAALLLPGSLGTPASTTSEPISAARSLVAHIETTTSPSQASPSTEPTAPAASTTLVEHTVARRDTLWDLAERYLAPGGSNEQIAAGIQQIFDLNRGKPQPDGATLVDASVIEPGWVLLIPVAASSSPREAPTEVTVLPGDSLWEIAEDHLGDGHRYVELVDLNLGDPQPDGDVLTDPSLVRPGWRVELPAVVPEAPQVPLPPPPVPATPEPMPPVGAPVTPPAPLPSSTTTESIPATSSTARAVDDQRRDEVAPSDESSSTVGSLGIAAGLLAAGLAAAVGKRRLRQRARRAPGQELPPLPTSAEPIVSAIAEADLDLAVEIDRALRRLGRDLSTRASVPTPVVVTLNGADLELLLDRSDIQPPDGWAATGQGRIWQTELPPGGDESQSDPAWLPALATIGAIDTEGLLLNLEAVAAVALTGDDVAARALARSVALELAITPLADMPAVHVVGDTIGEVPGLPGISGHRDLASALVAAEADTAPLAEALARIGAASACELRCRAPEEAWQPAVVVVAATEADGDTLQLLVERCRGRRGVVAVILGECAGALEVVVTPDEVTVPSLGLRCVPQQLDIMTADAISELLEAADQPSAPPAALETLTLFEPSESGGVAERTEPKLRLRLLGPMSVEGAELRPQQLAIVAYLALHPEQTADALREAVWGGKNPTRERFLNTIHELRRAVGHDVLPASTDGRYRLHHVWCDLAELERLVASAAAQPDDATADLRAALELVAGPPFAFESRHRRHFRWVDLGNHSSRWERIVGDAAHDLASIALGDDDVDLARWAAERGLVAVPGDETLTADLVSAHVAGGDRATAERVVDEYARAMEDLGYDEPPTALYKLLQQQRAS